MANNTDPDQLASSEVNSSGSTLFAMAGISGFSRIRVNRGSKFLRAFDLIKLPYLPYVFGHIDHSLQCRLRSDAKF